MRIAIMAAGAVGGYFGARLAAAGHDVAFIARGAHRDAIKRDGLKVEPARRPPKDAEVTDDPGVGLVEGAVRGQAVGHRDRWRGGAALVGASTRVITLQNGVDSVDRLTPILGDNATIGGSTYVVAKIVEPGVIRHTGTTAKIRCGRLDRRRDDVLARYVDAIKAAGIDVTLADDMLLDIWKKFVLLSGTSGATAGTRQQLGVIRDDPHMRAFLFKLMSETAAVGRAAGVGFPGDFEQELTQTVASFPPTMKASMANDLEAGNRLELDWLAGTVAALGRKHGVATPTHERCTPQAVSDG
jgi:2-dehydropantoate 2-reductase